VIPDCLVRAELLGLLVPLAGRLLAGVLLAGVLLAGGAFAPLGFFAAAELCVRDDLLMSGAALAVADFFEAGCSFTVLAADALRGFGTDGVNSGWPTDTAGLIVAAF
jgi:hypothetical protein